jgi:hypothetical protein
MLKEPRRSRLVRHLPSRRCGPPRCRVRGQVSDNPKQKLPLAVVLLGMICAIGVILSGQRYFLLQAVEDALKTQEVLDESFLVAVNAGAVGPNASQSGFAKAIATHLEQTADVRRAVSQLSVNIGTSEILSVSLWAAALVVLAFVFIRKRETSAPPQ